MTATVNSSLLEKQASFLKAKPIVKIPVISTDTPSATPISNKPGTFHRDKPVTFPEIFTYALPSSPEVLKLNELVEQIWIVREGTSLVDRDDSKIAEAFLLMSDIIDVYWDKFSVKTKVLLLDKLQPFNKNIWQFILDIILKIPAALKEKFERNKEYASQYNSLDRSGQEELNRKFFNNFQLLVKSVLRNLETTSNIFRKDRHLLEENEGNIDKFNHSIKTMIAARYLIEKHSKVLEKLAK
jgi:hypothetical protein